MIRLVTCWLSAFVGWWARRQHPRFLARFAVRIFARAVGANVDEAALPLEAYSSVAEFFTRDLKPGLRPIAEGVVMPVDGTLRDVGDLVVDVPTLTQVKGVDYTVEEFVHDRDVAKRCCGGRYLNLYLSPRDYHHIHSPVDGAITRAWRIPGVLWPVNNWSMQNVPKVFAQNERVVLEIQTSAGTVWVVMVGATNVGDIGVTCDPELRPRGVANRRVYRPQPQVRRGERIGTFFMGSSVVVLAEPGVLPPPRADVPRGVCYGEPV